MVQKSKKNDSNKYNKKSLKIYIKNSIKTTSNLKISNYTCSYLLLRLEKSIIKEIGSGTNGLVLLECLNKLCKDKLIMKFIKLKKKYKYDSNHPASVETNFNKEANYLEKITPHIIKILDSFDCNLDNIIKNKTLKEIQWFHNLDKLKEEKIFRKNVKINILETADTDLLKLLIKNNLSIKLLKIIFFQIFYTLVILQYNFPGFRHNDLKANNILVVFNDSTIIPKILEDKFNVYILNDQKFYIPQTNFTIKIHDFDFVSSDKFDNSKVKNKYFRELGILNEHNSIYDLHYFLNTLFKYYTKNKIKLKQAIIEFIYSVFDKKYLNEKSYYNNSYRLLVKPHNIMSPYELLFNNNFFKEFLKPQKNIEKRYNSKILEIDIINREDILNKTLN